MSVTVLQYHAGGPLGMLGTKVAFLATSSACTRYISVQKHVMTKRKDDGLRLIFLLVDRCSWRGRVASPARVLASDSDSGRLVVPRLEWVSNVTAPRRTLTPTIVLSAQPLGVIDCVCVCAPD